MDKFIWGIETINTSVCIPNLTQKDGDGYFEDRRPAANIDLYLATSTIAETCCL
jgi:glutamine synthetase